MSHRGLLSRTGGWTQPVLAALSCAVLLGACAAQPDYRRPATMVPAAFKELPPAAPAGRLPGTWQAAAPGDVLPKGAWWKVFQVPELDRLEDRLDINNQTLMQYLQNLLAARAQVAAARAGYFPVVSLSPAWTRAHSGGSALTAQGSAGAAGGVTASTFALPSTASWAPDLWGRIARQVEGSRAAAEVSAADLENERLTEQASLAEFYFQLRGQDALQEVYERTVKADRESLALAQALSDTGVGDPEAVAQAAATLAGAEATATGIAINRAVYEHAIATLCGTPASGFALPVVPLSTPVPRIPVGVPSRLLERRPDIAAAERTVAQANAAVGVASAAWYPSVLLSAGMGLESSAAGRLFALPALLWSLGAQASATIYDGGLRTANLAQASASYQADVAAYRQTVLTAFQQVEDALATLTVSSQQIARQQRAVEAAEHALALATARFETGLDPYLNVLVAQTLVLGNQQTLVGLRTSELVAAVQLIQALGGGWDGTLNADLPEP